MQQSCLDGFYPEVTELPHQPFRMAASPTVPAEPKPSCKQWWWEVELGWSMLSHIPKQIAFKPTSTEDSSLSHKFQSYSVSHYLYLNWFQACGMMSAVVFQMATSVRGTEVLKTRHFLQQYLHLLEAVLKTGFCLKIRYDNIHLSTMLLVLGKVLKDIRDAFCLSDTFWCWLSKAALKIEPVA